MSLSREINAQIKPIDNYTFCKLYVTDNDGKILLVKWKDQWEIPGDRYNTPTSLINFLEKLSSEMGIKTGKPQLRSIFTQRTMGRENLTIMHYYKLDYSSGDLIIPEDCSDIKWFKHEEALSIIPYPIMVSVLKEIDKNPGKIIGAAFERSVNEDKSEKIKVLENFYFLN